jgi:F-type H+-transporting ATPase subunit a
MDAEHHATNAKPLDFSITKNVFNIMAISLLLLWLFGKAGKSYKTSLVPTGGAKFFEPIIIFVRDEIAIPNIGEKHYKRYMSFLLTVFFFIWIVNLFGLTPLGINITNSIAVTFSLAIITFLITQFSGKKEYWMHIFWMPGVPWPMKIILAPIELLGVFIKPFALMIRLYANITAGHVVLMSLMSLIFIMQSWLLSPLPFLLTFALSLLELLVAALQAYIFTMLSALYFGSAVAEHEHEHGHEHH